MACRHVVGGVEKVSRPFKMKPLLLAAEPPQIVQ